MSRWLQFWLSLSSVLTITLAESLVLPGYQAIAQPASAAACRAETPLEGKVFGILNEAYRELERKNTESTIRYLQEALPLALQLSKGRQAELVQRWLVDANEGYPISRFQRLMEQVETESSPAIRPLLDQFLQLTNRLNSGHSFVKTKSLAAIARHYVTLKQPQQATLVLSQAQQAARSIQGSIFTAQALTEIAAGYAALSSGNAATQNQAQTAQAVLAQVEQAIKQIPPNTSEPLQTALWPRLAAIYAQIGDSAKANQAIAKLPQNSEARSFAQRGVVEAYVAAQNLGAAEPLAQAIATPVQKGFALGKVAVGYSQAKQPQKATQLLSQAVQLAQSSTVALDPIAQKALLKALVESYLQAGQRDAALKLAKTSLKGSQAEALRSVAIAYARAGQNKPAQQLLSERLSAILAIPDDLERRWEMPSLVQLVVDTRQFDWVHQESSRLAGIDSGVPDELIEKIAIGYAQTGQYRQTVHWVKQFPLSNRPLLQIKLMSAIARVAHRQGNTQEANGLLQQTLQSIDPLFQAYDARIKREGGEVLERDRFKSQALALIAVVYAQANQTATARQLLQSVILLEAKLLDSPIENAQSAFSLFMSAEQYVGALQLAAGTKNSELRAARLQTVATTLLKQNRFDLALPVVNQLPTANRKTQLLLAIAQRYGELQQVDKALPLLSQAFRIAQTIPGEESQVGRAGNEGLTVFEIDDDRGSLLEAIAVQYARFGQPAQALQVANTLQGQATREQARQAVNCATNRKP